LVRELRRTGTQSTTGIARVQGEFVRKSLHLLIAIVPILASANLPATLALLAFGTLFYAFAESSRRHGNPILVVSDLTLIASRDRDKTGFVLGPVTLGLGAMISLLLYPEPAASIAIYALAFGDGLAALVGRVVGGQDTLPSREDFLGKPGLLYRCVRDGLFRKPSASGIPHYCHRGDGP
jgi:dolichol kinase